MAQPRDLSRAVWRKSTYSQDANTACVEVAQNLPDVVAVRDSRDQTGPALVFDTDTWRRFTGRLKEGMPS